jgi:hypothetical protein
MERDRRVVERGTDISEESRRALRGRVARLLIEEIRVTLEPVSAKAGFPPVTVETTDAPTKGERHRRTGTREGDQ